MIDRYTKVVLTVMAVCLLWLCLLVAARTASEEAPPTGADQVAVAEVLCAETFELRDETGRLRAELRLKEGEPTLWFYDTAGHPRAALGMTSGEESSLNLWDKRGGNPRCILSTRGDSSGLHLWDRHGVARAGLSVERDGPVLGFQGTKLRPQLELSAFGDEPRLRLQNQDGRVLFDAP